MSQQERAAAETLRHELNSFYDGSDEVEPIRKGDPLHNAIVDYRLSLPNSELPGNEAILQYFMLRRSRSKDDKEREQAKVFAVKWDELLTAKYSGQPGENQSETKRRRNIDWWLERLNEYEIEWAEDSSLTPTAFAIKIGENEDTVRKMFRRAREEKDRRTEELRKVREQRR